MNVMCLIGLSMGILQSGDLHLLKVTKNVIHNSKHVFWSIIRNHIYYIQVSLTNTW